MTNVGIDLVEKDYVAEFALSLRNLSFLLDTLVTDDQALDRRNLVASLFALRQKVDSVSEALQNAHGVFEHPTKDRSIDGVRVTATGPWRISETVVANDSETNTDLGRQISDPAVSRELPYLLRSVAKRKSSPS